MMQSGGIHQIELILLLLLLFVVMFAALARKLQTPLSHRTGDRRPAAQLRAGNSESLAEPGRRVPGGFAAAAIRRGMGHFLA